MGDRMNKLIFITGNAGKAKYLSDYFHMPVEHMKLDLDEIQSLDLQKIVEDKAQRAFEIDKKPILVEDISLTFTALDKLPGPLIKWFFETLGNERLCKLLNGYQSRDAIAEVKFALHNGSDIKIFGAEKKGRIAEHPRGDAGFGWDPIFIPEGYEKTWAEMGDDEKHETSMRRIALEQMMQYFKEM